MTRKIIHILAVAAIFLCSCKKEYKETTTISATVKNTATDEIMLTPLNIEVRDIRTISEFLGSKDEVHIVDEETILDGTYEFSFNALKDKKKTSHNYVIVVEQDNGNYYFTGENTSSVEINTSNNIELKLHPFSYVSYKFLNTNCATPTSFSLFSEHLVLPAYFVSGVSWDFEGCTDYNQGYYSTIPMGKVHFEWHVTRNSITDVYHDTLEFAAGDSILFEINY